MYLYALSTTPSPPKMHLTSWPGLLDDRNMDMDGGTTPLNLS